MRSLLRSSLAVLLLGAPALSAGAQSRLLRQPTISERHVAFAYAGDIWLASRDGGDARRLTSFQGVESHPHLSPDGRTIAFSAQYGGNIDVYTVPVEGGEPVRLTWHPGPDIVQGWMPDGRRVVFSSSRTAAPTATPKFWTVGLDGDFPQALPMHRAYEGTLSPDGKRAAYRMVSPWETEFRNYRGGQNRPVWLLDLQSLALDTIPSTGSNDGDPVWIGDTVYFLSDRDWAMNVWSYDTRTRRVAQVTKFADFDVKNLNAGGGVLVFEQGGWIHTHDPRTGQTKRLDITARGDFPWSMAQWKDVGSNLTAGELSPTGARAVFQARGEIFTVPASKGDWRNLTRSPGVADRSPVWAPNGRHIAWFSDASGEYRLVIAEQDGLTKPREIELGNPTFYYRPAWSPDSRFIAFTDADLNLWYVEVATGKQVRVDVDTYMHPDRTMDPVWSPDGKWIAYSKRLPNQYHVLMAHSVADGKNHQLTDGMSDAIQPAWDAGGKYLYFLASTNFALSTGWLDMTSYDRPVTRSVYLMVLRADEPSPLLPESDEERARDQADTTSRSPADTAPQRAAAPASPTTPPPAAPRRAVTVRIDLEGLANRIISIGLPARNYTQLATGPEGHVFVAEQVPPSGVGGAGGGPGGGTTIHRWQLREREARPFLTGVQHFTISADGKKALYRSGQNWGIVDTDKAPPAAGAGRINTSNVRAWVDPKAEWKQIFREGWRYQRDFLYVAGTHGADWPAVRAMYEPMVEHVNHRADLTWLLDVLGGEVSVGHSFTSGGDNPNVPSVSVGLLGADLEIANGRYRIRKIYTGENWNPSLGAPLAAPGVRVSAGNYILEVNGVELRAPGSPYRLFENTAGRQTVLRINDRPATEGSWTITVVPVASEGALRQFDWVESNRRKVDQLSRGKLAYVWLPNTGQGGYNNFNRYYFAQQDKQGAVIDERFNSGGSAADYIVDILGRQLHGFFNNRIEGHRPFTSPGAGIWGPKVMIINEMAGSGGDLMPHMFRQAKIGPLVGTRTWGGLVGTWDTPPLIDGGNMIAPRGGYFNLDGEWDIENEGVAPDIHVELTPADVAAGRDPQLERAVQEALRLLEQNPVVMHPEPPAPKTATRRPGKGG